MAYALYAPQTKGATKEQEKERPISAVGNVIVNISGENKIRRYGSSIGRALASKPRSCEFESHP